MNDRAGRRADLAAGAATAAVAFLPFARGVLSGQCFYFRDLSLQFFPVRRFVVEGLRHGLLRYWNPFTHEGEALALPPVGYPADLLQVLAPGESGFSLLLAFHVPLAAIAAFVLLRHLAVSRTAAAAGAIVYALGGFALSTVNLYVYVQALAWAPLMIRGLLRAAEGRGRDVAWAAVFVAMALSTTGVEIVGQALLVALVLARPGFGARLLRMGGALLLGLLLAAPVLAPVAALVGDSARQAGLPTGVTLAHSIHPVTLLQTVISGLYGNMDRVADVWWGQNFFPRGFPYFLSLYLGAAVLAFAASGVQARPRPGRILAALGVVALLGTMGQFIGLAALVEHLSFLRRFRYPSKAFYTVHLVATLLCAFSVHELGADARRARRTGWLAVALGACLLLGAAATALHAGLHRFLLAGFFPPDLSWPAREAAARAIAFDAVQGGMLAVMAGALALAAATSRLPGPKAAVFVTAVIAADVLHAGAGLNPMVTPAFFRPSPEAEAAASLVRAAGGRLFTVDVGYDPRYFAARATRPENHEVWSFGVMQETFLPDFNLRLAVPTAYSVDRTMLVPEDRVLAPEEAAAAALPAVITRLQAAAVTHVMAIGPLDHPALAPVLVSTPPRVSPLALHVYRLLGSRPREEFLGPGRIVSTAGDTDHVAMDVDAPSGGTLALREALGPGWTATVDGKPAALLPFESRYWTVPLPAGRHVVRLDYHPPGLTRGLWLAAIGGLAALALGWRGATTTPNETRNVHRDY